MFFIAYQLAQSKLQQIESTQITLLNEESKVEEERTLVCSTFRVTAQDLLQKPRVGTEQGRSIGISQMIIYPKLHGHHVASLLVPKVTGEFFGDNLYLLRDIFNALFKNKHCFTDKARNCLDRLYHHNIGTDEIKDAELNDLWGGIFGETDFLSFTVKINPRALREWLKTPEGKANLIPIVREVVKAQTRMTYPIPIPESELSPEQRKVAEKMEEIKKRRPVARRRSE